MNNPHQPKITTEEQDINHTSHLHETYQSYLFIAAQLCQASVALVSLGNNNEYWYSLTGDVSGELRGAILSSIEGNQQYAVIVTDTFTDTTPISKGITDADSTLRFFIIIPIQGKSGEIIGSMSLTGKNPLTLSDEQIIALKQIAQLVYNYTELQAENEFHRAAAQKLDGEKKFYETILNVLPTEIVVFDPEHKYRFVNPYAIKEEEARKFIIGKDDFDYCRYRNRDMSLAQQRRERFLDVKSTGREIRWEDTINNADGIPITTLRRIFPVFDDSKNLKMVIGFGLDISERKVMEEKQTLLVNQLSAQNTQLIDFCNIISHNLRAPLVNMAMLVEYIQESEDEDEKNDLLSKLKPVIENLHNTFNELVESIQIKQNIEIESENIVFQDCLQRVLDELAIEIKKSGATIQVHFTEAPVIYYPPKYIFSILQNLLSNALKYQSPHRKPEIIFRTEKKDGVILLSVKDNCQGIDMEMHKNSIFKIGKVFHRHPNAKGFGLFMTKTQVEAMQGRIWVESTVDVGSTFFIEFKTS